MKNKVSLIVIAILVLLLIITGGLFINAKLNEPECDIKVNLHSSSSEEGIDNSSFDIYRTIYEQNDKSFNVKVILNYDDNLIINTKNLINELVEENVVAAYYVTLNQGSACYGNSRIIMKTGDNKFKMLLLDSAVCGDEIKVEDITLELQSLGINDIKVAYSKPYSTTEYDSYSKKVYVTNENYVDIDITNMFLQ